MRNILYYTKTIVLFGALLVSTLTLFPPPFAAAQEPLSDLRLLAWSADGDFLLGSTPGRVVTRADGSLQQLQTIWRLAAAGSDRQQLVVGFDLKLSPDRRRITLWRLDVQGQASPWSVNVDTGKLQPLNPATLPASEESIPGDPQGRVYVSPDGSKRAILVNEFFGAALWIGVNDSPVQLILRGEGELFSDLAWHPNGQVLALIRTPLGSQTDSSSELWRLDLSDNAATRLSQNNVVDRSPLWSANGSGLAVVRNEQVRLVAPQQPMVEFFEAAGDPPLSTRPPLVDQAQLTPPSTIRVIHHERNTCRTVPVGQIDSIPFEEYVKRVVPHEVFPSWPAETLKAQAVAARTYGWDKYLQNPGGAYHVTDWVNHQYMCDNTVPSTSLAVDETAGEYLAYNGQPITAMFSAENSSPTKTNSYVNYLLAVDDPVSFGQTLNGHGYGLGQWGAQRWAAQFGWSYQAILRHYYANVTLEEPGTATDLAPPNVALVAPWSDHYLTGNKLRLALNASDDGGDVAQTNVYLTTPSESNLLISQNGPASSAAYVVDVSAWTDQALPANGLVLTAEAFDAGGRRGVSPPVTIGLDRVAPQALLTTATTLVGTPVITDSPVVSLTLTGFDATAGVTGLAIGHIDWAWEGESLMREEVGGRPVGQIVADAAALNGIAVQATVGADPPGSWSSSEINLPAPQQYRAYFRLKADSNAIPDEVARLEIIDNQRNALVGLHRLYGTDFRASGMYQEFHADFDIRSAVPVSLRLKFQDAADVSLDRIIIVAYPTPYTSSPASEHLNFRLKVIDGAGNVSDDLLVVPEVQLEPAVFLPAVVKGPPE